MAPTTSGNFLSQSCEWSPVSIETKTVMPRPTLSGSMMATRRVMTPSPWSFSSRFQQGVDDRPTRWPISATEREASSWTTARIFRSTASILFWSPKLERSAYIRLKFRTIFLFVPRTCLYREKYSISRTIYCRVPRFFNPRTRVMKTFIRFSPGLRRLGAAILFSAAMAASVAGAHADPLVSAEWLNAHRADQNLVVLDIRSAIDGGGAQAYAAAHIPGSVHSDY